MTKLPLNDVRVFTQNTWPQPILVSDKGESQLFIHYYRGAREFWRTWQTAIKSTEKEHHVPSNFPLKITVNNLMRRTMLEKNAHESFWKSESPQFPTF